MKHFPIKSPKKLTDKEKEAKARFDAAFTALVVHDDIEHDYRLPNSAIRMLGLACIELGNLYREEKYLMLSSILFTLFVRNNPDLKPHVDELLDALGVFDIDNSR